MTHTVSICDCFGAASTYFRFVKPSKIIYSVESGTTIKLPLVQFGDHNTIDLT